MKAPLFVAIPFLLSALITTTAALINYYTGYSTPINEIVYNYLIFSLWTVITYPALILIWLGFMDARNEKKRNH